MVANVLAKPIQDPAEIVQALVAQVTGTVRWRELVAFMAQAGVDTFYEIGAGKVLSGLIKRIADGATSSAIGTPDDVAAFKAREERMMFDLTGKTALVTGATGAIGGAIARALHAQGATVAISGTRRDVLDALAGELERPRACAALRSGRHGGGREARAGRRSENGKARHPGRQCRRQRGQFVRAA